MKTFPFYAGRLNEEKILLVINEMKSWYKDIELIGNTIELTPYDFNQTGDADFFVGYYLGKYIQKYS